MACGLMVSIYSFFFFFFFTLPLSTGNTIVHLHLRESAMFSLLRLPMARWNLLCQDPRVEVDCDGQLLAPREKHIQCSNPDSLDSH